MLGGWQSICNCFTAMSVLVWRHSVHRAELMSDNKPKPKKLTLLKTFALIVLLGVVLTVAHYYLYK